MALLQQRRYPVGIQTFEKIRKGRYVYVDKTDLVYQITQHSNYVFLARPRRFGKSLLVTTMKSFFEGRRELFKGLKIMALAEVWTPRPVFHLDLSTAKDKESAEALRQALFLALQPYVERYGKDPLETTPGTLLRGLLRRAHQQSQLQVVVLVDEYDAPLLDVLHEERIEDFRRIMQEFYQPLKAADEDIHFCFITGITKFSQLSIFSTINNISDVTLLPKFAAICGITEEEVFSLFSEDIQQLAQNQGCSEQTTKELLKRQYDGYHFASVSPDVYNPFSLLNCFNNEKVDSYWFGSGTPSFLIHQLQHFRTDITSLDDYEVTAEAFNVPTEAMTDALPILYQSGYLTIKGYDQESDIFYLGIPNQEVRLGMTRGLIPFYTGLKATDVNTGFALLFWRALQKNDIENALQRLQGYLAQLLYVEGFKKKLQEVATAEGFYEWTLYLIFSMLNVYVRTQVKCRGGRVDVLVKMAQVIYVIEIKLNGSAQQALEQINDKGYALPYQQDGRKTIKVGLSFSTATCSLDEWVFEDVCK